MALVAFLPEKRRKAPEFIRGEYVTQSTLNLRRLHTEIYSVTFMLVP
ncbi:MAG: hypothetical protein ACPG7F_02870 [Aggregatilineales bacterium]